jgi:hypothetical protein
VVELDSGTYTLRSGAVPAVLPFGKGEQPVTYAWSPGGERLVASVWSGDPSRPAKVVLHDGGSSTLWEGSDIAPRAAWAGREAIVVGFKDPRVWSASGAELGTIAAGGASIERIDASRDERRLIAVDVNRTIALIDGQSFAVLDRWSGAWAYGAIDPDGRFAVGLDTSGALHFACIEGERLVPAGQAEGDRGAAAVAVGDDLIAIAGGGELRVASLAVACGR